MSIFSNMMGAYQMGSEMMGDSFAGGMGEVEDALLDTNKPMMSMAPNQSEIAGGIEQMLGGGEMPPQQSEMDETQVVGSAADGNIPSGGGGGMLSKTLSGDSIAGNIAGTIGDMYTGGMVSQMQNAYGAAKDMKDGGPDAQNLMKMFGGGGIGGFFG